MIYLHFLPCFVSFLIFHLSFFLNNVFFVFTPFTVFRYELHRSQPTTSYYQPVAKTWPELIDLYIDNIKPNPTKPKPNQNQIPENQTSFLQASLRLHLAACDRPYGGPSPTDGLHDIHDIHILGGETSEPLLQPSQLFNLSPRSFSPSSSCC